MPISKKTKKIFQPFENHKLTDLIKVKSAYIPVDIPLISKV